jgi:hypothetical protein
VRVVQATTRGPCLAVGPLEGGEGLVVARDKSDVRRVVRALEALAADLPEVCP